MTQFCMWSATREQSKRERVWEKAKAKETEHNMQKFSTAARFNIYGLVKARENVFWTVASEV